ncbi:MAG TPA: MupA/Atu3671 family FMN-dependent luciferase-like monooxygenase, partial [Kofleriaceae bacterium]|nr:MupA/Atu3671 family FMN-dependent luciferase-like monooxygenase [Kofleriaceae bacterium]
CLTGAWMRDEEATSPEYWGRQMREPVRFGAALDALAEADCAVFVEAGPDQALSGLVRGQLGRRAITAPSLRRAGTRVSDHSVLMRSLAELWMEGQAIDWTAHHAGERRRRVPLPAYPFERSPCRLESRWPAVGDSALVAPVSVPVASAPVSAPVAATLPLGDIEQQIAEIWRERLGVAELGRHDNFLEVGGNSLMAAQVLTRLRELFPVQIPLVDLFEAPTVAGIAARIEERMGVQRSGGATHVEPITPAPRGGPLALSVVQARVLAIAEREPDNPALHMPVVIAMRGALDVAALERAIGDVVRRHEILRTTYRREGGSIVATAAPSLEVPLAVTDLRGRAREEALALAREEAARPFDLGRAVLRAGLVRLADDEHWLLLTVHHVACDTWSLLAFVREVSAGYAAGGRAALPELAVQYADFAAWQEQQLRTGGFAAQRAWWDEQLAAPAPLDLVAGRAGTTGFRGGRVLFRFSRRLTDQVHAFGEAHGATPFMTVLAAYAALLARHSGQEDILVGTPIGNRSRPELEPLIGYVAHSVALRADLSGDPTFTEILARVRQVTLDAYANPDVPCEAVLAERGAAIAEERLFDAVFVLQGGFAAPQLPGLELELIDVPGAPAQWGATLAHLSISMGEDARGFNGALEYDADRFDAEAAARLMARLERLLEDGLRRPNARLSLLDIAAREEERALPARRPRSRARGGLDLSLSYFANDEDRLGGSKYSLLVEGARFADRNGFSAVWTPERHFHPFGGLYPSPAVVGAGLATITERIQIRAGSVVMPLHDPIRVAEEWAVLDNLSGGRVGVSFASGWHASDFVFAPDSYAARKQVMLDGIETVRALWRGEAVTRRSGAGKDVEVRLRPRPVQRELPFWLTAAGSPDTFRAAGELAAGVLTNLMGQTLGALGDKIALYRRTWADAGHAGRGHVTLMMHAFLGDEVEAVRQVVRGPLLDYFRSSVDIFGAFAASQGLKVDVKQLSPADIDALVEHGFDRYFDTAGLFGTPESCAPVLEQLSALDVDEVACLIDFGVDVEETLGSLAHLAVVREQWSGAAPSVAVPEIADAITDAIPDAILDGAGRPVPWGVVGLLAATGERARMRRDGVIEPVAPPSPPPVRPARARPRVESIPRAPRADRLPLSFAQQRLWYLDQLEPDNPAYNNPVALRLTGELDVDALERAIDEVVRRHEVLRTRIAVDGGSPAQQILPELHVPLERVDLSGVADAERDAEVMRRARSEASRTFALDSAPLVRATLLRLAGERDPVHVLLLTMHHIVSDGWSAGVLFMELGALYAAFAGGQSSPLPELAVQYADYALWQRRQLDGPELAGELAYWKQRLAGLPALELPADRQRPPVPSSGGARQRVAVPAPLATALAGLAREEGATPFMGLLAALEALLHRYTGQLDFGVGTPVAGRNRPEVEPLVGCFVNTLVLRADLSHRPSFRELVRRVRRDALGAFAHQELPFERLVDGLEVARDLSRPALFQVMLVLHNTPVPSAELQGLRLEGLDVDAGASKFDLTLELREVDGELRGTFEYSTDLFDGETIAQLARHFEALVAAAVAEPERGVDDLPLLSAAEEEQVVVAWNDTAVPYPSDRCLHQLFEEQAARTPDAVAVAAPHEGVALRYGELDRRADALARLLVGLGVSVDDRVGLLIERSASLVVGILGALKAGAAYVPIDPAHPPERIAMVMADAGVRVLLARRELVDRVPSCEVPVVCVDEWPAGGTGRPPAGSADSLAYVMYTSGSTGRPKGVAVPHRAVVRMVEEIDYARWGADESVLMFAATVFDASSFELWSALLRGARAVVYPPGPLSLEELGGFLAQHRITTLLLTSGVFQLMAEQRLADLGGLRQLMVGGDVMSPAHARRVLEALPGLHLLNAYGPTEAATMTSAHAVDLRADPRAPVPIGRPVPNARVYVLDARMQPVPVGVPGELHVGGDALARGYFSLPGATAQAFVPDRFGPAGGRLYRTGDRVRWRRDGSLEFLGRIDLQLKVRGFRVEPGEIEAALSAHPRVRHSAVVAREDAGGRRLVAYLVAQPGGPALDAGELRGFLKQRLPEWMVPSAFVSLEALPLTRNGKLDRAALPAPEVTRAGAGFVAPGTVAEQALAEVWCEVLGLERVGAHDNFFDLGGDSILSIRVIARARERGLALTPRQMFQHQTVAEQAAAAGTAAPVLAEQGIVSGPAPLTPIERWFFEQDLPERHHFNLSLLLEVPPVEPDVLRVAMAALLEHHDALRLRFHRDDGGWRQEIAPAEGEVVQVIDAGGMGAVQAGLDLVRGPLVRAALLDAGESRQLLLALHHIATDVVSLRILLEDLARAVDQLQRGEAVQLPAKSSSFALWAERLAEHALSDEVAAQAPFWASQLADSLAIPRDEAGENREGSSRRTAIELDEATTRSLLHETGRTQVPDLLLTALVRTVAGWTGRRALSIDLESHGREPLFDDVDLSRTVGWFTAQYPVRLELPDGDEPGAALAAIGGQLRALPPGGGIGYGLLRYLSPQGHKLAALGDPEMSFNYLGQIDLGGLVGVRVVDGERGAERSPLGRRPHLVDVDAAVLDGRLRVVWSYSGAVHRAETIEALAASFAGELRSLVDLCALQRESAPEAIEALPGREAPLAPVPRTGPLPLSFMQERLWFLDQLEPGTAVLNTPVAVRLRGTLDLERMRASLDALVVRHESLRCRFPGVNGAPVAVIDPPWRVELPVTDLRGREDRERAAEEETRIEGARPFDLATGPVVRARLLRLADDEHLLVVAVHHIVADGWSGGILLHELGRLYAGHPLPALPVQYADYAAWERGRLAGERLERQLDYWRRQLDGAPPVTELPADRPRPRVQSYRGERVRRRLGPDLTARLRALSRAHGATTFMTLLAGFDVLVARWAGQDDVVIGTPVGGRPRRELEAVVGPFLNTVALRVSLAGAPSFTEVLDRVRQAAVEAFQHQDVPFEKVLQAIAPPRALSHTPVFQLFFNMLNFPASSADLPGLRFEVLSAPAVPSKFDLTVYAAESQGGVDLELVYNADLFGAGRIEELAAQYERLLEQCAADPQRSVSRHSLV